MRRFSRAQQTVETAVLIACAVLVVAFYAALVTLVVGVWATKNDVTVRIALTVFALAWFWPIAHALIWRRARRSSLAHREAPAPEELVGSTSDETDREVDLTVFERPPASDAAARLDAGHHGRAASV
jgi:small-conductance mechanosensitive channel